MIVNEGGKKLPKLTTPGTSADLLTGKQLIDQYGNVVEGDIPIVEKEEPTFLTKYLATRGQITATAGYQVGYYAQDGGFSKTHTLSSEDDPNFVPENIVSGKTIFGVAGSAKKGYYFSNIFPNGMVYENTPRLKITLPAKMKAISYEINYSSIEGYSYSGLFFGDSNLGHLWAQTNDKDLISGAITRNDNSTVIELTEDIAKFGSLNSIHVSAVSE